MRKLLTWLVTVSFMATSVAPLQADMMGPCAPATPCVTYQTVQRTIMVPTMVTEMRTVQVTKCRPELRQCVVNVPGINQQGAQNASRFFGVRSATYEARVTVDIGGRKREMVGLIFRNNNPRDVRLLHAYWK